MRILFLATNDASTEASTRYRISQYLPALKAAGHECTVASFYPAARGKGSRTARFVRGLATRIAAVRRAGAYDLVFVSREILPFAWNHLVHALPRDVPLVFDFDDAVFLPSPGARRPMLPHTTRLLIERAAVVFAGNSFLGDYALRSHDRVVVLPTVVDTETYRPRVRETRDAPVVGWIGSPSTSPYLETVLPVLDDVAREFRFRLRIIGAGRPISLQNVEVETPAWTAETEAASFGDLDIGLYPLPNERWVLGKCGFKAIQYMASGVASIVSPVGVAREIVRDGKDGIWANSPGDYRAALATLLGSAILRASMGAAGRERAEGLYSLRATTPRFLEGLAMASRTRGRAP